MIIEKVSILTLCLYYRYMHCNDFHRLVETRFMIWHILVLTFKLNIDMTRLSIMLIYRGFFKEKARFHDLI